MGLFGKPDAKPEQPTSTPQHHPQTHAPAPAAAPVAAAPAPAPRGSSPAPAHPAPSYTACVVGANITFKGEITGDEDVLVEGTIEGQIRISRELRVGPRGKVKASVSAQSVIISGELVGDCDATGRVEIQATGRLMGNIRAPKVVITEGAVFRGNSDMSGRRDERNRAANS
jgi:cytoskeletal protein CcmA (bactofilin family)